MKLIFLFIFMAFGVCAQDSDVSYLETQNTISSPFSIPAYLNEKGEFSIFNTEGNSFSFNPLGQFSLVQSKIQYVLPVRQNSFLFMEQEKDLGWVEIKRKRIEFGLGIGALSSQGIVSLGLTPYKGSYQSMMRTKKDRKEITENITLPSKLEMMKKWEIGDQGSFQAFGGIQASVGLGVSLLEIVNVSFILQNQFIIGIRKIDHDHIILSVGEESVRKRQVSSGTGVANFSISRNKGKLFTTSFVLNLKDADHQKLYEKALRGKLADLQVALPSNLQKTEWAGAEKSFYVGLPWVAGKAVRVGHFDIDDNGLDEDLDIRTRRNSGLLLPLRNHKAMVYQTEKSITFFWASEMKQTHTPSIERNFLSLGRAMGISGFDVNIPEDTNFGSTITHIGIALTRDEIDGMRTLDINDIAFHLKSKCEEERLNCSKKRVMKEILEDIQLYFRAEWSELRHDLGRLLGKHPALIYALVRSRNLKKKVYFKFLSERYQSIEGMAPIDL